jgi:hypothetical protein
MSDSVPPSERRTGVRYLACYPASIVRDDGSQRDSLIRDISISGVLLLVNTSKLKADDKIDLRLFISDDFNTYRRATGKVVRVEDLPPGSMPWSHRVAVKFDEVLVQYQDEIDAFKDKSETIGWIR